MGEAVAEQVIGILASHIEAGSYGLCSDRDQLRELALLFRREQTPYPVDGRVRRHHFGLKAS